MGDHVNASNKRTLLLTGATSGLGYEIVKNSNGLFDSYILIGRDAEKLLTIKRELLDKQSTLEITYYAMDFSDELEVFQVSQKILTQNPSIDVWINNAGALYSNYERSKMNIEKTMVVNYLSHFILINTLIDKLPPNTQIINIVSSTYKNGEFESLFEEKDSYSIRKAYADSKLALMKYSKCLSDNYSFPIYCFHPGRLKTDIGVKHTMIFHKIYWQLSKFFAESPEVYAKFLLKVIQKNFEEKDAGIYWNVYNKIYLNEIQNLKEYSTLMRESNEILEQIKKMA